MNGEVNCPYKDKCTSYPHRCPSCKHNKGKRDYYEPDYEPNRPWYPYPYPEDPYPYIPYWRKYWITTWCSE